MAVRHEYALPGKRRDEREQAGRDDVWGANGKRICWAFYGPCFGLYCKAEERCRFGVEQRHGHWVRDGTFRVFVGSECGSHGLRRDCVGVRHVDAMSDRPRPIPEPLSLADCGLACWERERWVQRGHANRQRASPGQRGGDGIDELECAWCQVRTGEPHGVDQAGTERVRGDRLGVGHLVAMSDRSDSIWECAYFDLGRRSTGRQSEYGSVQRSEQSQCAYQEQQGDKWVDQREPLGVGFGFGRLQRSGSTGIERVRADKLGLGYFDAVPRRSGGNGHPSSESDRWGAVWYLEQRSIVRYGANECGGAEQQCGIYGVHECDGGGCGVWAYGAVAAAEVRQDSLRADHVGFRHGCTVRSEPGRNGQSAHVTVVGASCGQCFRGPIYCGGQQQCFMAIQYGGHGLDQCDNIWAWGGPDRFFRADGKGQDRVRNVGVGLRHVGAMPVGPWGDEEPPDDCDERAANRQQIAGVHCWTACCEHHTTGQCGRNWVDQRDDARC